MRRLVGALGLVLGVLATAGCEGRQTDTRYVSHPRPVHCTVLADEPDRDAKPPTAIVGRVRFRCDPPGADTLTLTVRLEHAPKKREWTVAATQTFTLRGEQTAPGMFRYYSREVRMPCSAGRFRTVVRWCRVSHGDTAEGDFHSFAAPDPCAPGLFG